MREIEETWDLAHDLPSQREYQVAEIGDGEVRGLGGDDDLQKLHLLRPHQIHRGQAAPSAARHGVQDLLGSSSSPAGEGDLGVIGFASRRAGKEERGGEGRRMRQRGREAGEERREAARVFYRVGWSLYTTGAK